VPVRVPRRLAAVAVLALLPACTNSSPKPGPSEDPDVAARGRLAVLAQATADGEYDAIYHFVQHPSEAVGVIRIRQVPPRYRIDVTSKGQASFFALDTGVVSCTVKAKATSCFLVAKPGEEVPPLFDPGVQRLFRDAVEDLARHPSDYHVRIVGTPTPSETVPVPTTAAPTGTALPTPTLTSSPPPLPTGVCFAVERLSTAPPTPGTTAAGFENGTYCFAEQGVATRIEVQSGVLDLVGLGGEPNSTWFIPPAKVQELPALTPTPSTAPTKPSTGAPR